MCRRIVAGAALMIALLAAGCSGIPQDDRYQTHDGGRSNTRAEASWMLPATLPS